MERDRNAIIRAGGRAVLAQYAAWRRDMLAIYRGEGRLDVEHQARDLFENVRRLYREAAAIALLRGYRRVALSTGKPELRKPLDERGEYTAAMSAWAELTRPAPIITMRLPGTTAFEAGLNLLRRVVGLTTAQAGALAARFDGLAVQASARLLGHASAIVDRAYKEVVAQGLSINKGVGFIDRAIRRAGLSPAKPWAVEREIRNTANLAYSAGRETGRRDPVIRELIHSLTYVTVGDDRVRPSHAALDGVTRPPDDPFWDTNTPPNGHNCRCTEVENFDRVRLTKVPPDQMALSSQRDKFGRPKLVALDSPKAQARFKVGADQGWRFNPGDLYGGLVAA